MLMLLFDCFVNDRLLELFDLCYICHCCYAVGLTNDLSAVVPVTWMNRCNIIQMTHDGECDMLKYMSGS